MVMVSLEEPALTDCPTETSTAATVPAMGAVSVPLLRACWAEIRLAWSESMVAWSLASWAALLVAVVVGVPLEPPDELNPLLLPDGLPLTPPDAPPLAASDELPLAAADGLPVLLLAADSLERIWARAVSALWTLCWSRETCCWSAMAVWRAAAHAELLLDGGVVVPGVVVGVVDGVVVEGVVVEGAVVEGAVVDGVVAKGGVVVEGVEVSAVK
jgi:hypothetical protein